MKHICSLLTVMFILSVSISLSASTRNWYAPEQKSDLFTLADAEKILGEPAHLSDSASDKKADVSIYRCSYTANAIDTKTGKTGVIYVMIEEYAEIESAHKTYSGIMEANRKNGITELKGVGDEAYFHTDNQNFYFVLVRKGQKVLRMKVNKITSVTSLDEFNRVANKITLAL